MGTYIKTLVEVRTSDGWKHSEAKVFELDAWAAAKNGELMTERPFYWQSYRIFGFLAGVRNEAESHVLSEPRGLPEDADPTSIAELIPGAFEVYGAFGEDLEMSVAERVEQTQGDRFGFSWLSAEELLAFDYDQEFSDRREQSPEVSTYRDFLGEPFFRHLAALAEIGPKEDVRILFCFD